MQNSLVALNILYVSGAPRSHILRISLSYWSIVPIKVIYVRIRIQENFTGTHFLG